MKRGMRWVFLCYALLCVLLGFFGSRRACVTQPPLITLIHRFPSCRFHLFHTETHIYTMPSKSGSSSEQVVDIDPLVIHFTFSRIRPRFSCGRTIESTLQQFRDGELQPRDLPLLSVLTDGTHYFSQNNRRLYTYKQLKREGVLDVVPVRLRPFPQTKRMQNKYTPGTCSLTATLMRDVEKNGAATTTTTTAAAAASAGMATVSSDADAEEHDGDGEGEQDGSTGTTATENVKVHTAAAASLLNSSTHEKSPGANCEGDNDAADGAMGSTLPRKHKKDHKKHHGNTQQQRGTVKGRGMKNSSDSDDDGGDDGGVNYLEAELRKLGLQ
jgi:hypothetical protein